MDGLDKYRVAGRRAGLFMAVAGLVVALVILTMLGLMRESSDSPALLSGLATVTASTVGIGWSLGGRFGVRIARGANPWLSGLLLAFVTVVGTALLMSAGIAVLLVILGRSLDQYLLATLAWLSYVLMFGAIPMITLGLGYGAMLQRVHGAARGIDTPA